MEQKDYVSYDVAKLLKDKGYNKPCDRFFEENPDGIICWSCVHELKQRVANGEYLRPTFNAVLKWLSEEYNISVEVTDDRDVSAGFGFDIEKDSSYKDFCMNFKTYEAALNKGIKQALEYI